MSVCWLSSASGKTFRTFSILHGDAILTSLSMETITWKTLYLLPWATGGHLHGDTWGFNIECVSLMCHMDSLVEETSCILFWKKYGTLLFNIIKNLIWFNINVMLQRTPPLCVRHRPTRCCRLFSLKLSSQFLQVVTWYSECVFESGRSVSMLAVRLQRRSSRGETSSDCTSRSHVWFFISLVSSLFFADFLNVRQKRLKITNLSDDPISPVVSQFIWKPLNANIKSSTDLSVLITWRRTDYCRFENETLLKLHIC